MTDNRMERWDHLRNRLEKERVNGLIIFSRSNVRYLTGFTGSAGILMAHQSEPWFLITDGRYAEQVKDETSGLPVRTVIDRDYVRGCVRCLVRLSLPKVGFEDGNCTVSFHRNLQKRLDLKKVRLLPMSGLVEEIRSVKDQQEIHWLKESASRADRALEQLLGLVREGVTERELAWELECRLRSVGSQRMPFPPIVLFGERTSLPHGQPSDRKLKKGDWVLFDFGAVCCGYVSDITRTFFFGRPGTEHQRLYRAVWEAQQVGLQSLREGTVCRSVDLAVRKVFRQYDLEKGFVHGTGHGVGLDIHEMPGLDKTSHQVLKSGMVVTVEPGVYFSGRGGVRLEDMALVTEDGFSLITHFPNPPKLPIL